MLGSIAVHRIVIVALLGATLVRGITGGADAYQQRSDDIAGLWDAVALVDGQPASPGLVSFHESGVVIVTLSNGASAQGIWESSSGGDYLFNWVQLFVDAQGMPIGRAVITAAVTVDDDTLFGQLSGEATDTAGETTFSADGSIDAVRLTL